ncbi:MAG: VOC family protein [Ginsengibacter sp.]
MKIPEGYQAVMPYLILENAESFIDFTQKVFEAKVLSRHLREDGKTVQHAEIQISGSVIMCAESTQDYPPQTSNLFIYVDDADQAYEAALQNGSTSVQEPSDKDYGRACGITDPTGNTWWITSTK